MLQKDHSSYGPLPKRADIFPSQSVTLRTLVPVNGLISANALMSQAFYTMRIIARAAGLLVYWLGYNSCFYLDRYN